MSPSDGPRAVSPDGLAFVSDLMRVGPVAAIPQVMAKLGVDADAVFSRLCVILGCSVIRLSPTSM
jgi:hypothetical protein